MVKDTPAPVSLEETVGAVQHDARALGRLQNACQLSAPLSCFL